MLRCNENRPHQQRGSQVALLVAADTPDGLHGGMLGDWAEGGKGVSAGTAGRNLRVAP